MINVIPNNDEREHECGGSCWCEPEAEWADPDSGEVHTKGPIWIHNSADCREYSERVTGEGVTKEQNWTVWEEVEAEDQS